MTAPRRVALITGAAKRVGRAIALQLADEGFDILFTFKSSRDDAKSLAEEILTKGRRTLAIELDLTQPEDAVARLKSMFIWDRLDVIVNNASLYEPSSLTETSPDQINRLMAIHFQSPLLLCRTFAPMLRASRGHVVNMVDLLAEKPWPEYLAYCASKAALMNLTLGLARELAPDVTVNGIAPGVVEWPDTYPEADRARYLKRVPLARAGTPQDVADAVAFLVTRGKYITGQILRLDGGRSIT